MLIFNGLSCSGLIQLKNLNPRDIFRDVGVAGSNPVTPTSPGKAAERSTALLGKLAD